jgi:hypothetical protein
LWGLLKAVLAASIVGSITFGSTARASEFPAWQRVVSIASAPTAPVAVEPSHIGSRVLLGLYCALIVGASLFGGWLPRRLQMSHTRMQVTISLIAGLMLSIGVFHMLPHALEELGDEGARPRGIRTNGRSGLRQLAVSSLGGNPHHRHSAVYFGNGNRDHLADLNRQLTSLRRQQDRLLNLRLLDEVDESTFASKSTEIRDRISRLNLEVESCGRSRSERSLRLKKC